MARDATGTMTATAGQPVTAGTVISPATHNALVSDLVAELTDSLSRSGKGGMTAPLRTADGSVSAPALSFTADTNSGIYRAGADDLRVATGGADVAQLASTVTFPKGAVVTQSAANTAGVNATGNGTAAGVSATGGATGNGVTASGGATSGAGVQATGTATGAGVVAQGGINNAAGVSATGGGTGPGVLAAGGSGGGNGITATATGAGNGVAGTGKGSGSGGLLTGGDASGAGVNATGGGPNGHGVVAQGTGTGYGITATGGATDGIAVEGAGQGNGNGGKFSAPGTAAGCRADNTGSGPGGHFVNVTGSGPGLQVQGNATRGTVHIVPQSAEPSAPSNGDLYYDSDTHKLRLYAGGAWVDLN